MREGQYLNNTDNHIRFNRVKKLYLKTISSQISKDYKHQTKHVAFIYIYVKYILSRLNADMKQC